MGAKNLMLMMRSLVMGFEELIGLEEDGVSGDWKEEIVLGENEERFW